MGEKMTLTDNEIAHLLTSPDALRAVADYNDWNECMADSTGADASYNRQRREWLNAEAKRIEAEWDAERKAEQRVFLPAHLTQPAQEVDVGAEDRFEQYVKTLIDKAPDVQKLGERLALWLDDDQFNNIEPTLLGIARALTAALPNANGKEG